MNRRPGGNRRRFLAGMIGLAPALRLAAQGADFETQRLVFTRPQMGVPFRIVVHARDEAAAQRAVGHAYDRIGELNRIFSDYDPDSEVSRLCHETPVGMAAPVSEEMLFILLRSQALAAATDGAFDVTVGPLVNLWRRARRLRALPEAGLLEEARAGVGWRFLEVDARRRTVTFHRKGMRLDFGAIVKGYAADEALRILREEGFPAALIAAAGDLSVGDAPPGEPGWKVEAGQTDLADGPAAIPVVLRNGSVATSGDIFQRLEIEGRRYSHILDPRTGIGLTDHGLVVVIAPHGITSDSLATAVSVLGVARGLRLVDRTRDVGALVYRQPEGKLETSRSRRWRRWQMGEGVQFLR